MPEIAREVFEPLLATLFAMRLFHLRHATEAPPRLTAGFLACQAGGDGIPFGELEVGENLAIQLLVHPPVPREGKQAPDDLADGGRNVEPRHVGFRQA